MVKFPNTFSKGTVNKDLDARFIGPDELIDAENFFVSTLEASSGGVGKNALGNALKTAYNITGGHTIGHGVNTSNGKVYNLIKGTNHDYIIEYDSKTFVSAIVAQSTTGTRLNFKTGERITNVEVLAGNTDADTLLKFSGDSNPPRILNIARAKTWGIDGFTAEEIMLIKAPPLYPPTVVQINTSDLKENFLEDKYLSFATRYKYKDNYYSAISTWQEYAFTPDRFQLDFSSCENKGMVNIYNGCDITFTTGPREVIAVDLLFKYSISSVVYKVDQFVKSEESWGDNISIPVPIRFTNSKVFSVLPEDQYFRSYDNVPESLVASTMAGNRAMFANYKENKDLIDKNGNPVVMDYSVGVSSVAPQSKELTVSRLTSTSIFDASTIVDGKIRLNFTGTSLVKGGAISVLFNIKTIAVVPAIPGRLITTFDKSYATILDKDYANIAAVITDDAINGFKSGIEGYLSDLCKNTPVLPTNSLGFPPSIFNGFTVTVVSSNVIDITLPSIKYEIEVLPSGPNTFVTEYFQDAITTAYVESIGSKKSMKSYRSYELVAIYKDAQGRKTTGLSSTNNTVFIPISKSASKNMLTVNMGTTKPPFWATTYKFAIKENIKTYEEIYVVDYYVDGNFRWVRLEGTSKNKVNEGDTLLIKSDAYGILTKPIKVKVLEIKNQDADFVSGGVVTELAGMYMKIKPEGFSMDYNPDAYQEYLGYDGKKDSFPTVTLTIPKVTTPPSSSTIPEGSLLSFTFKSNFSNEGEFNEYPETSFVASSDYANIKAFYDSQLSSVVFQGNNTNPTEVAFGGVFQVLAPTDNTLQIRGTSDGNWHKRGFLDVKVTLRTTAGFMIFENPSKEIETGIFYETPDVFNIVNGDHEFSTNILTKTFNCYSQGNGAESYQIRDSFNEKYLSIDFPVTAVSSDQYRQVNRFSNICYSGVYNSDTNINKLNEFNLYLANFKEDIDKSYGPIVKIKGTDSNLEVRQEDKCSVVFYGKDILYNADGESNLTKVEYVLGEQKMTGGEYGISYHAESADDYGANSYFTDTKRGVVLKDNFNNGLFEISSQGMNSYFKKLFRDNVIDNIIGEYDQYHDVYVLNIKYNGNQYVTWIYSDKDNGWLGRITFNPEDMCRVNGKFLSFYNGEIYEHNQATGRNTFYGVEYLSKFVFNFSQAPSERKIYKNIEIEGTDAWEITATTDLDSGQIDKTDFVNQEGVQRAYIRTSDGVFDSANISAQGVGNCTVAGLVLSFTFLLEDEISVGDTVRNINNAVVGKIVSKTAKTLTLDAVANLVSGDYVMVSKSQSAESRGLLGYHLQVSAQLMKNTKTEVYAVNTNITKSYV